MGKVYEQNVNDVVRILRVSETLDEAVTKLHEEEFGDDEKILYSDRDRYGDYKVLVDNILNTLDDFEREIRQRENRNDEDWGGSYIADIHARPEWPDNTPSKIEQAADSLVIRQR